MDGWRTSAAQLPTTTPRAAMVVSWGGAPATAGPIVAHAALEGVWVCRRGKPLPSRPTFAQESLPAPGAPEAVGEDLPSVPAM